MPIVSHTLEAPGQATEERHVVVRFYDQDGKQYMQSFWWPANQDLAAYIASRSAEMSEQLAQDEFEALVGAE